MTIHVKRCKNSMETFLKLMNEFSEVAGYSISNVLLLNI